MKDLYSDPKEAEALGLPKDKKRLVDMNMSEISESEIEDYQEVDPMAAKHKKVRELLNYKYTARRERKRQKGEAKADVGTRPKQRKENPFKPGGGLRDDVKAEDITVVDDREARRKKSRAGKAKAMDARKGRWRNDKWRKGWDDDDDIVGREGYDKDRFA